MDHGPRGTFAFCHVSRSTSQVMSDKGSRNIHYDQNTVENKNADDQGSYHMLDFR